MHQQIVTEFAGPWRGIFRGGTRATEADLTTTFESRSPRVREVTLLAAVAFTATDA